MGTESKFYKEILNKLEKLVKREYELIASLGIQATLIIAIGVFTLFSFTELIGNFSSEIRTLLFFIFLVGFIGTLTFFFILPLLRYFNLFTKPDYFKAAGKVGNYYPEVKDDLKNALQLVSFDNKNNFYSVSLINAAFKNAYDKTKTIRFERIISFKKAKELLFYLTGVTVFCAMLFIFVPGLQAASNRLVNFDREFIPPPKYTFEIYPGNSEVTKGDDVQISVRVKGGEPKDVFLFTKTEEQTDFEQYELKRDSSGSYNFKVPSVRSSFNYFAIAEDVESEEYLLNVVDRPVIKTLDLTVTPPRYSGLPVQKQKDNGNITSLVGSRVDLSISSTKNIDSAFVLFNDSTSANLSVNKNKADGKFYIRGDKNYKVIVQDENGNLNQSPIEYSIKALTDAYPTINIIEPNRNVDLANDNRLPLFLKVADDYGFTNLILHHRLSSSKYEPPQEEFKSFEVPFENSGKEIDISYVWNLTRLNLATEDVVTYYLEIFDNDNVSGPKSAVTQKFSVRVPTLDEILNEVDKTHNVVQEDLKETLKEADQLQKELEKIDRELKKDQKELTWEEKENIEKALDKFEKLQEKVENTSKKIQDMQNKMQENNLLSKETMEKYMELQELMNEMTGDEMKMMMEKMQNMLQKMNREMTQNEMENLKLDEERFKKSVERTLNLLKRIQVEQKVDELLKRTEELQKKQDELKKQTENENLSEKEKDNLEKKQNEVSDELNKMEQEMKELSEKMNELDDMPMEEMQKAMDEFNKQNNQELSEDAMKNLQQNQLQKAQQMQQQISQNMKKMNQQMQNLQSVIQQQNQMQTFTDMMKMMDNILTLSKQQEELKQQSQNMDPNSQQFKQNAQQQNNLSQNLDKLMKQMSELSQKTFAITPEMGKALGDAKRKMQQSLEAMQNRNGMLAQQMQGGSMKSLNEAATMMKGSMESMMQGGGQGGMMSMMQQLQQMSQQQMNLNNMTQMLKQQQGGKLSPQQQAQLQKLAQQQDLIRKSMGQLNQEAKESGKSKTIPADLENIMEKMQEVVKDMSTQKLDDNLIQKQERILSRLLDAQRSINERDYEKNRESKSGQNFVRESPGELNLSTEKGRDKLRDELNKAVQEGYTKDYENLIRKYYEALQKEQLNN